MVKENLSTISMLCVFRSQICRVKGVYQLQMLEREHLPSPGIYLTTLHQFKMEAVVVNFANSSLQHKISLGEFLSQEGYSVRPFSSRFSEGKIRKKSREGEPLSTRPALRQLLYTVILETH